LQFALYLTITKPALYEVNATHFSFLNFTVMKQGHLLPVCAILITVTLQASCKKENSTASGAPEEESCKPVTFSSAATADYIVLLKVSSQSAKQLPVFTQHQASMVLQRHRIAASSVSKTFYGDACGFVARLSRTEAFVLATDSSISHIEPDRVIKLDNSCFALVSPGTAQWGVRRTGAGNGLGKTVWVIDTGVDFAHPDLNVDEQRSKNFVNTQRNASDDNGHGSHAAGIIAALNNNTGTLGVASGATIVSLKVLNSQGEGNTSYIIQALNYVGQQAKAGDVVNMSLGADTVSLVLDNTVKSVAAKGILFAIAAGNSQQPARLSSPARVNHPNVFTISAIDSMGKLASFSNYGNDVVDYAAPGVRIVSTYSNGRYARLSGTSMAAPHVAGILLINGTKIVTRGRALNDTDGTADAIAGAY